MIFALLLTLGLAPTIALGQATQPADRPDTAGRGPAALLQRVRDVVNDLKLTDEQKAKVEDLMQQARQDLRQMMQTVRDLPLAERREKVRSFVLDVSEKIAGVLSDEQRATFRKKIEELREQVQGGGRAAGAGRGAGAEEPGPVVRRLREAIGKLDLSEEQKQKVESLLKETQEKAQILRRDAQADAQNLRAKGRELIAETRAKLSEILSPDQQAKLRELMQSRGSNRDDNAAAPAPATVPATKPSEKSGGGGAQGPPMATTNERLGAGQPAPEFRVTRLDGTAVQLDSFQGKLSLIAFGSFTSPSFRQRVLSLEDLRREYGSRVSFLIIYTREAHPTGQWEVDRNREQQISIAEHKDLTARKEMAKQARTRLKINIPIAVDSMEDDAARAYHAWPNNAAVLIDKDGAVFAYQQWFDAYGMKQAIQEALSNKPKPTPASQPTTEPHVK
jgi:Spy/CpxP family protein refolding chaperone